MLSTGVLHGTFSRPASGGCPSWQDGKRSHIVIVYHGQQLSQCEQGIKDFVKSEGCFCVVLYKSFDLNIKSAGHDCCSQCVMESCDKRSDEKLPFKKRVNCWHNSLPVLTRVVSDSDK